MICCSESECLPHIEPHFAFYIGFFQNSDWVWLSVSSANRLESGIILWKQDKQWCPFFQSTRVSHGPSMFPHSAWLNWKVPVLTARSPPAPSLADVPGLSTSTSLSPAASSIDGRHKTTDIHPFLTYETKKFHIAQSANSTQFITNWGVKCDYSYPTLSTYLQYNNHQCWCLFSTHRA